jgi:hypothetical protein
MHWKYVQKPGVQIVCEEMGLSKKGTRDEMIELLRDYDERKNREVALHPKPDFYQPGMQLL